MVVNATIGVRCGPALPADAYAVVRRRTIFECCKWDPQVQDVSVLAPFPVFIGEDTWGQLAIAAESLAAETLAAESELVTRPDLLRHLGLPRAIVRALRGAGAPQVRIAPVMRFDFHPTTDGWRISEVNSDVPGGYIESSGFTRLMHEHFPAAQTPPDPAACIAHSLRRGLHDGASVALVHATAYTDDRQVMHYLAGRLVRFGLDTVLVSPDQIRWSPGGASIASEFHTGPVHAAFRFYPAEWLPNLSRRSDWRTYFAGSPIPLSNPATALLTQSKRFPLVWDQLCTPLDSWRQHLPETSDPRNADWRHTDRWVLKPALGRVGDSIAMPGVTAASEFRQIHRDVRRSPRDWAAQRRFESIPIETPDGPHHLCLGVFVIDGRAAGIYGRLAPTPLINQNARDVAILIHADPHDVHDELRRTIPHVRPITL